MTVTIDPVSQLITDSGGNMSSSGNIYIDFKRQCRRALRADPARAEWVAARYQDWLDMMRGRSIEVAIAATEAGYLILHGIAKEHPKILDKFDIHVLCEVRLMVRWARRYAADEYRYLVHIT